MPILAAEPDLYPLDLWDAGPLLPRESSGPRWWCLHTKPRQEKATARYLRSKRMNYYLPLVNHESRTPGGRKISSIIPLFPSYLFFHGDDYGRIETFKGNTLVRVLEVPDQGGLEGDLRQIYRMLAAGMPVVPEPTYPVGTQVRILTGPLQGLVGIVSHRQKRDRFTATVQFLGQGASVELQDWQVEPVPEGM